MSATTLTPRGAGLGAVLRRRTEWRAVGLLLIVLVVFGITQPDIFGSYGVTLSRIALDGLVALGLTLVILQGELDLSVGSVVALSGTVLAVTQNLGLGIVFALLVGVAVGVVNALLVIYAGVNSFIATLGTLFAVRGLAFVVSGGKPVSVHDLETAIGFGTAVLGPLTPRVLIFFGVFIVLQLFLTRVKAGREFYAVGGNRQAAIDAGIPVKRRLFTSFIACSVLAALAGIVNTLELTSADPTAGSDVLLSGIAAAVVGGILLNGGRGSLVGTLIGAAALGALQIGLDFAGVSQELKEVTVGAVLVLAIITDADNLRSVIGRLRYVRSR
jgi:ribose/xylose/arabinose/galactoside ABC-type transport system permease subunit